jgi:hypothetical protein
MSTKNLLILKATADDCSAEISNLEAVATMAGISTTRITIATAAELITKLNTGTQFDFLYICAHGNENGFGESNGNMFIPWDDFAIALCATNCLESDAIVFLACCFGGIRRIADILFATCNSVSSVCGPRWSLEPSTLTCAFHALLHNLTFCHVDPYVACKRASEATGHEFFFYSRLECESVHPELYKLDFLVKPGRVDAYAIADLVDQHLLSPPPAPAAAA